MPSMDKKLLAALLCEDPKAEKKKRGAKKPVAAAPKNAKVVIFV